MQDLRLARDRAQQQLQESRQIYDNCYLQRLHQVSQSMNNAAGAGAGDNNTSSSNLSDCEEEYNIFKKSFEGLQKAEDLLLEKESEERRQMNMKRDQMNDLEQKEFNNNKQR